MQYTLLSLAALAVTASAQQMMNLTATLTNSTDLTTLTSVLGAYPMLLQKLSTAQNITVLAPSNMAFAKYMNSSMGMSNDTAAIQTLLSYHVLNGTYPASAITANASFIPTSLTNLSIANVTGGQRVEALAIGKNVTFFSGLLANSTVTSANINFTGGIVHIIDTVLTIPQNITYTAEAAGLSAAVGALNTTRLISAVESMQDITAFVPNNAAFQAIGSAVANLTMTQLHDILQYHVVEGTVGYSSTLMNNTSLMTARGTNVTITMNNGSIFVNSAKVLIPDVLISNGVVHVIDNVLNPNATMATPIPTASVQSVAFMGASSASMVPFTSGVPMPTAKVGGGVVAATSAAVAASSSAAGAAAPIRTGAIGAAALFAAGGAWINA